MPTDLCWAPRKMQKSGTGFVQRHQIMILVASTGGPLGCVWKIKTFYIENFYLSILDQLTIFPGYCLDGTVLSLAHPWPQSTIVRFHQRNIVHRVSKDHLRYCSHPIHPLSSLCIYRHVGLSECHFIKSGKLMASAVSGREIWRRRLFKEYCKTKVFATRVLWDLPLQRTRITKRTKKKTQTSDRYCCYYPSPCLQHLCVVNVAPLSPLFWCAYHEKGDGVKKKG